MARRDAMIGLLGFLVGALLGFSLGASLGESDDQQQGASKVWAAYSRLRLPDGAGEIQGVPYTFICAVPPAGAAALEGGGDCTPSPGYAALAIPWVPGAGPPYSCVWDGRFVCSPEMQAERP